MFWVIQHPLLFVKAAQPPLQDCTCLCRTERKFIGTVEYSAGIAERVAGKTITSAGPLHDVDERREILQE